MSSTTPTLSRESRCACEGGNLERFIRPLALSELMRSPKGMHGYALCHQLAERLGSTPDLAGVYRMLKDMESDGYLTAENENSLEGPARRRFRITQNGIACLNLWSQTLDQYAIFVNRVASICREPL